MFILSEMRSMVRLEASEFGQPLTEAVIECLNNKLSNKILKDVGLVIALWDVIEVGESFIMPGSSGSHTKAHFRSKDAFDWWVPGRNFTFYPFSSSRLLVFRPFMDEVLVGKIKCCTKEGVYLSLGFFDDILIPPEALQHPHRFDESDQVSRTPQPPRPY